jgi:predicted sulfurtransferase
MPAASLVNIAAYKFANLERLKDLRAHLVSKCRAWGLKGTILLSTEGINLFVAGSSGSVENLLAELQSIPGLENLSPKYSENAYQPFNRMLVRIKKEIIAFGMETIKPASYSSRKIQARELKQ